MSELNEHPATAGSGTSGGRIAATVVMALPLLAMALAAVALPPGLAYSLVMRGVGEGHPSWVALGGITGGIWLLMLRATARKLGRG